MDQNHPALAYPSTAPLTTLGVQRYSRQIDARKFRDSEYKIPSKHGDATLLLSASFAGMKLTFRIIPGVSVTQLRETVSLSLHCRGTGKGRFLWEKTRSRLSPICRRGVLCATFNHTTYLLNLPHPSRMEYWRNFAYYPVRKFRSLSKFSHMARSFGNFVSE